MPQINRRFVDPLNTQDQTVKIGIHLEDDGWWIYCPECDIAQGPYATRTIAARIRGNHLVKIHNARYFRSAATSRGSRARAMRKARKGENKK